MIIRPRDLLQEQLHIRHMKIKNAVRPCAHDAKKSASRSMIGFFVPHLLPFAPVKSRVLTK